LAVGKLSENFCRKIIVLSRDAKIGANLPPILGKFIGNIEILIIFCQKLALSVKIAITVSAPPIFLTHDAMGLISVPSYFYL